MLFIYRISQILNSSENPKPKLEGIDTWRPEDMEDKDVYKVHTSRNANIKTVPFTLNSIAS